jgi:hypothetical protein
MSIFFKCQDFFYLKKKNWLHHLIDVGTIMSRRAIILFPSSSLLSFPSWGHNKGAWPMGQVCL